MKKFLTIASAVAVTAAAALAIEWNEGIDNLAKGATVTVSSNPDAAATITDGDPGSSWQATGGANTLSPDFALIDLGESKTFTDIEIIWEASHMKKYDVYVSETEIPYASANFAAEGEAEKIYNVIDAAWLTTATPAFADQGQDNETGCTDNMTEESGMTGRYILIYGKEYNGFASAYGSRIFEVRIANLEGRNEIGALTVSEAEAVAEGESATVTVGAKTMGGEDASIEDVENLTLTADREGVEIARGENLGEFTVTGVKYGEYTLTANGTVNGKAVSGSARFTVKYQWTKENIAKTKAISARVKTVAGEDGNVVENPNGFANATDGDETTYYEYNGEWGGGDAWVIVDLGEVYLIEEVAVAYGDNSGGRFTVAYGAEDAELPGEDLDKVWNTYNLNGWEKSGENNRASNTVSPVAPAAGQKARYIAVYDNDNPNGKPQVKEIYVAGQVYESPALAELTVSCSANGLLTGETVTLSATGKDQYGADFELNPAEVAYYVDGAQVNGNEFTADEKGTYEVTAVCGDVESKSFHLTVAAEKEDFFTPATGNYSVTFGGEAVENPTILGDETGRNENYAWTVEDIDNGKELVISLAAECDLDMIRLRWEAACPKHYKVTLVDESGKEEIVDMISERGVDGDQTDCIYKDAVSSANGPKREAIVKGGALGKVKTIKILPLESNNGNGWSNKLFGVLLYGTPAEGIITDVVTNLVDDPDAIVNVYDMSGVQLRKGVSRAEALEGLGKGIYVINGKKVIK